VIGFEMRGREGGEKNEIGICEEKKRRGIR